MSKSKLTKDQLIEKLNKHFQKNNDSYFFENILKILTVKDILKSLTVSNLNSLLGNIKDDLSQSPNGPASFAGPAGPVGDLDTKIIPSIAPVIASKLVQSLAYLPFDTKRDAKSPESFDQKVEKIKLIKTNANKLKAIMQITQLFENDIIKMRNGMCIQIINYLSLREDTLLYIGKVLTGNLKDQNVVVKVQPRIPIALAPKLPFGYQVTTEHSTMTFLQKNCSIVPIPKVYEYEMIEPLCNGDIERYTLVSELLGTDLAKGLKFKSVDKIKKDIISAIKAFQIMHKCNYLHLDIKHENMVYSDSTEKDIKIIDLGHTESIKNRDNERKFEPRKPNDGTPLYMATMQHSATIKDYMDDLQAFAWMLLDLLGDKPITQGMPWINKKLNELKNAKLHFIENCKNDSYTDNIQNGTLTKHNISIIGELADYTIARADKRNKYTTDKYIIHKKTNEKLYYCDYNDQYYKDIINIINKLK